MKLYYIPLSPYSQKVAIALYEKGLPFDVETTMTPEARAAFSKIAPLGKVPALGLDDGQIITESSIIIEAIDDLFPDAGTRLIPEDKARARDVRWLDRCFDCYFNDTLVQVIFDGKRPGVPSNPHGVATAKATLDKIYGIFDALLANRTWAAGDAFTMADCAAAPPLHYLRGTYPFSDYKNIVAYADRLTQRASFARVLKDAEPYLSMLPR
jgi:glutathione S-transferase